MKKTRILPLISLIGTLSVLQSCGIMNEFYSSESNTPPLRYAPTASSSYYSTDEASYNSAEAAAIDEIQATRITYSPHPVLVPANYHFSNRSSPARHRDRDCTWISQQPPQGYTIGVRP